MVATRYGTPFVRLIEVVDSKEGGRSLVSKFRDIHTHVAGFEGKAAYRETPQARRLVLILSLLLEVILLFAVFLRHQPHGRWVTALSPLS